MELKNKKVLVTGAAGFIGSHLVDALIKEDCSVRGLDNLSNGKLSNLAQHEKCGNFKFIEGSILDKKTVSEAIKDVDVIFHLACLGVRHSIKFPFENHKVNAEGTLNLLDAAYKEKTKKFIYCSSSEVYGTAVEVPMVEEHITYPCTVYGASKLAGETYTRAYYRTYGMNTVIIRPFNTYGPRSHHEGDAGELIPKSIVRAFNDQPILVFGDGSQTRDFTYVEDTAQGFIVLAKQNNCFGETFNIGNDFEVSIKEVGERIVQLVPGTKSELKCIDGRPGDVLRLFANSKRFRKMTGWQPKTSFEEGLQKTVEWFQSLPNKEVLIKEEKDLNWT